MTTHNPIIARRTSAGAAALFAAGVLFASVAPAAAVGMPPRPAPAPTTQDRGFQAPRGEMTALAEQPLEQAIAYCESRFRSYYRVTGTYLGYDGNEHPCP